MKEFKVGGKVKLAENEEYRIVDVIEYNGEKYYFASSCKKPINPVVFKRINDGEKTFIEFINDTEILKYISNKIINDK